MNKQLAYLESQGGRCPNCSSPNVYGTEPQADGDTVTDHIYCTDCGASWTDQYQLTGFYNFGGGSHKCEPIGELFTVMLLRPDYATDNYGQDTFVETVEADCVEAAIELVKRSCRDADNRAPGGEEEYDQYLDDLHVLAVMKGKVEFVL